jgi:hypothetical protein
VNGVWRLIRAAARSAASFPFRRSAITVAVSHAEAEAISGAVVLRVARNGRAAPRQSRDRQPGFRRSTA